MSDSAKKEYASLYEEIDRMVMKVAEDSLNSRTDRVNELIAFAHEAGMKTIGIANCITFEKEAEQLEGLLRSEGFEVIRANCKMGKMPRNEIIVDYKGISCNPAGQAKLMEEHETQLNLVMGLCVGHDIVFNSKSKAMTSTLLVKDRKLKHNPLAAFDK